MLYSLTTSLNPVTRISVSLDGIEQGVMLGEDLRRSAGIYFDVPRRAGTYQVTVSALDIRGCVDGESRPMTLTVR